MVSLYVAWTVNILRYKKHLIYFLLSDTIGFGGLSLRKNVCVYVVEDNWRMMEEFVYIVCIN